MSSAYTEKGDEFRINICFVSKILKFKIGTEKSPSS